MHRTHDGVDVTTERDRALVLKDKGQRRSAMLLGMARVGACGSRSSGTCRVADDAGWLGAAPWCFGAQGLLEQGGGTQG
jgi:hypothetical protein